MATLPTDNASIGTLLRQLVDDVQHLFRTELRLFQSEVKSSIGGMKAGVGMLAAGGFFLVAALITLFAAFVGWLTPVVGPGWAELIVSAVSAVLGFILLQAGGKKLSVTSLTPERTIASVKQDAETLKGH